MNEIKIYLKPSGSLAYLYKDFDLYEGCYRNSQLTVFVPKSLLYENENGTFVNLVKTGAILTAPNGSKLTTKSYYLDYEREQTIGGVDFRVYTMITPKEFCVYAGTQTVVVNVESIDNTNPDAQTIISVTTTQTADLIVLESAYLGQDEPIDPTELDKIKATLTEIQSEIGDLPNKYVPRSSGRHIVYVNDINGNPSTQIYAVDASGNIIVQRDGNGQIKVPLAPLQGYDATSKNYVDESIEALPSKYVTLDTDQTIDGTKGFTSPITVGGQTWHTVYMKDSFVYTVDGNNYEVTYPEKSGLMALKSDIPTDYVTQGQLAQTNQNVEDLYTILEQAQVVTVTTLEQAYTTRETADGENIVDGIDTSVKEIRGATVATKNLIPFPYAYDSRTINGITFTVNSDRSVTANGTATASASFALALNTAGKYLVLQQNTAYFLSGCPSGGSSSTFSLTVQDISFSQTSADYGNGASFTTQFTNYYLFITIFPGYTANNLVFKPMLNTGDSALPYMPYFTGLKNAYFQGVKSTGRNLISYPYSSGNSYTTNGITFTVNSDGSVTVNGTATGSAFYKLNSLKLRKGSYFLSGCPSGGGDSTYYLYVTTNLGVQPSFVKNDTGSGILCEADQEYSVTFYIHILSGYTANSLRFYPIFNYGSSALPYEQYKSNELSLPAPIELAEWDTLDFVNNQQNLQSETLVFNGTESGWYVTSQIEEGVIAIGRPLTSYGLRSDKIFSTIKVGVPSNSPNDNVGCSLTNSNYSAFIVWFRQSAYPNVTDVVSAKAQLAAWNAAGNPLTICYQTATATTTPLNDTENRYTAYNGGSETVIQGTTDNSEYGAENTVKQDYFTLTGGTTNV